MTSSSDSMMMEAEEKIRKKRVSFSSPLVDPNAPPMLRPSGLNLNQDCYCQPNWCCCFDRCVKIENMVGAIGFLDAMMYTFLMVVCAYFLLMWNGTWKFAESRGLTSHKAYWWRQFMVPNEDGFYILLASYTISSFAAWNLGLRYKNKKRCPGIWWMISNMYSTILQIVALIYFPFFANYFNGIPMVIRLFEYWILLYWDRYLVHRNFGAFEQRMQNRSHDADPTPKTDGIQKPHTHTHVDLFGHTDHSHSHSHGPHQHHQHP